MYHPKVYTQRFLFFFLSNRRHILAYLELVNSSLDRFFSFLLSFLRAKNNKEEYRPRVATAALVKQWR